MHRISIFVLVALTVFQTAAFGQQTADKMQLPGLKSEVTVRRDARGVSYIEAANDDDLYFAQGYITAGDRLWQMDLMRRLARGETAEIFGERTLDEDKRWRRFGFSEIADDSLQYLTPTLRNALDSYAKGVNAYIASLDDKTLPVEFRILQYKPREWRAADTVVIGKILADALSTTWRNDLMRLQMQQLPADKLADLTNVVTPYDVVLFGKDSPDTSRAGISQDRETLITNTGVTQTDRRALRALSRTLQRDLFTPEQNSRTADENSRTANENSRTANEGCCTANESFRTADKNCCTANESSRTANENCCAAKQFSRTANQVCCTADQVSRTMLASVSGTLPTSLIAAADRDDELRASSLARVGLFAEELAASNNWVISGKLTADGKALLANDPHLAPTAPGIWYLVSIQSPTVNAAGVTFPGVPGVVLGHNEHIAWGATNVGPDVQDLYDEKFNADGTVQRPNGPDKVAKRVEKIGFRSNMMKTELTTVDLEVTTTSNGPVILEEGGKKYALRWTALDPKNNEFEAFFGLNRARNWEDFKTSLKTYGGATQNFVYADTKGNIGWYAAGRIPIRRQGDGSLPYDASKTDGDWTGFIPFEELPHLYNPPSGKIITANQRIVSNTYKYSQMNRDSAAPWRAQSITRKLSKAKGFTLDDMRDAQLDASNIPNKLLADAVVAAGTASADTNTLLKGWDGLMKPDSRAALLANDLRACVANKIADSNKPIPAYIIRERILERAIREDLSRWLPAGYRSYADVFKACDADVIADHTKRFGADQSKWTWSRVWTSRLSHPLAAAPFIGGQFATPTVPIDGSGQSPNVGSAVSMRLIASPGNWDATRHTIPLGNSGNPASPHFKDQFESWNRGTPAILPFSKQAIEKATVSMLVLAPK